MATGREATRGRFELDVRRMRARWAVPASGGACKRVPRRLLERARESAKGKMLAPAGAMGCAGEWRRVQEGPSAAYSGALRKSPQTAIFGGPGIPATPRHMRASQESVQRCAALHAGTPAPETAAEGPSCTHLHSLRGLCGAIGRGTRACGRAGVCCRVLVRASLASPRRATWARTRIGAEVPGASRGDAGARDGRRRTLLHAPPLADGSLRRDRLGDPCLWKGRRVFVFWCGSL